jgi:hypothetical protein
MEEKFAGSFNSKGEDSFGGSHLLIALSKGSFDMNPIRRMRKIVSCAELYILQGIMANKPI